MSWFRKPSLGTCIADNAPISVGQITQVSISVLGWGFIRVAAQSSSWPGFRQFLGSGEHTVILIVPEGVTLDIRCANLFGMARTLFAVTQPKLAFHAAKPQVRSFKFPGCNLQGLLLHLTRKQVQMCGVHHGKPRLAHIGHTLTLPRSAMAFPLPTVMHQAIRPAFHRSDIDLRTDDQNSPNSQGKQP